METIILVTNEQKDKFLETAAIFDLSVTEDSQIASGTYYRVNTSFMGELFSIGAIVGHHIGLRAAHQPDKTLQN